MLKILLLECKGIYREYKSSFAITFNKVLLFLLAFMFFSLLFYIVNRMQVNESIYLNAGLSLSIMLGISLNKDIYLDYLQTDKSRLVNIFPIHKTGFLLLKGIKYELVTLVEVFIIFATLLGAMAVAGTNVATLALYLCCYCLLYLLARNVALIFSHNIITNFILFPLFSLLLKSLLLTVVLIIAGNITRWFDSLYNQGENPLDLISKYTFAVEDYVSLIEYNFAQKIILYALLFMVVSYVLKVLTYSYNDKKNILNPMNRMGAFLKKTFSFKRILWRKEYLLLHEKGVSSKIAERCISYFIAFTIILILKALGYITLMASPTLILIITFTEVMNLMSTYTKTALGHERQYVIYYILSGYQVSDLLLSKSKLISRILIGVILYVYLLLSVIFNSNLQETLMLLPIVMTFIVLYSVVANYTNTYKTSYSNQFMIPHKLAATKTILFTAVIAYFNISVITILSLLNVNVYLFSALLISAIHLVLYAIMVKRVKSTRKEFYGEYSDAIG